MQSSDSANLSLQDLVELGSVDAELYGRGFFPRTFRQPFADMHHDAWNKLESQARQVNLLMMRGAGKTSHCRVYTSKKIGYNSARTILYLGKSEGHAVRSTSWIMGQVERNRQWSTAFNLRKGSKWQPTEFEIYVGEEETPCWVMAAGILGSIRGLNRDDFRPDLIVLDDVLDDENAHTPEQRQKIENLVYGAVLESLAPATEAPHAKLVALNTPQHKEDFAVKALKDPAWLSAVYGCWTKETANYPVEFQKSSWEERYPSETLRKEKRSATARNMLSVFQREKECKLTSSETASFKAPWLKRYSIIPEGMLCSYAIDPVPPPSEAAVEKGLYKTDFEAHVVWGALGDNRYLLDYALMRGHEPTWTISTFMRMQQKWRPFKTRVETVAYQRTLMWILRQAMDRARVWYAIEEYQDKRKKFNRIVTTHNGIASAGRLWVRDEQTEFIEAFSQYPDVSNDDILDASAIALEALEGLYVTENGTVKGIAEVGADEESWRPLNIGYAP